MSAYALQEVEDFENRRHARRKALLARLWLVNRAKGKTTLHTVWTLDVSESGVRIRSQGSLIPGATVELLLAPKGEEPCRCRVVWTSPRGPEWYSQSGLEFKGECKLDSLGRSA